MLVKFKRDYTVYQENNKEFTFEKGYAYQGKMIQDLICVESIDGKVGLALNEEEQEKYLE